MQVSRDAAKRGFYYLHVHDLPFYYVVCENIAIIFFIWKRGWGYLVTNDQLVQDNYI